MPEKITPEWRFQLWRCIVAASAWMLGIHWKDARALHALLEAVAEYRDKKKSKTEGVK